MTENNKVAIIGGTGKSGQYLVNHLIAEKVYIKMLVRNREHLTIESPYLEFVDGDVSHYESVLLLVQDCKAVISTLGMGKPVSVTTIFSQSTRNVIKAMRACNIARYIVTTGLNVDTPSDNKNPKVKLATDWMKTNYPETTADKQLEYTILKESDIEWTLVRLPLIELTTTKHEVKVSLDDCPGDNVSATDLADFLHQQLTNNLYYRQAPFIASK